MKFFATSSSIALALASISCVAALPGQAGARRQETTSSAPSPLTPAQTNEGSALMIQWDPTTNSSWKSMEIKFMTGANQNMTELYTVATGVDGTTSGAGQLQWTAPDVNPNSKIYFFQFTRGGADPTWTTRFAIADEDGNTTDPPYSTQPEGTAIPWGIGRITSSSSSSNSGSSASSSSSAASSATSSASSSSSSSASRTGTSTSTASTSRSSVAAANTSGFNSGNQASSAPSTFSMASAAVFGSVLAFAGLPDFFCAPCLAL
ncbi:hypothetical protein BCV70DRAFT_213538 [Testicularia cyperi]|uniref:Yeast cell wall synthesis Kre9/Knh1-like N-terminal domain-containing protein n=1 Tax=Testicularia cyperi TaxID=1882483 RepID=A0A317XID3_9BASI|nr:hypothetical protein BCV70DRAFT_213538 [Testicularia cyperi]